MPRPQPLSAYPAATLQAMRTAAATLLRHKDILPTDLSMKIDLFHGDLSAALRPTRLPAPAFTPHPQERRSPPERPSQ